MKKGYQAPIVKKAFRILKAVANNNQGMRISDISSQLDISKSTVHGITAALEEQGVLKRDSITKRYVIGLTLIELGKMANGRIDLIKAARPHMEELMEQCQETVFLGLRNGNKIVIVDSVESPKNFKITSPIGTSIPLLAGSAGKVFLSQMKPEEAKNFLFSNTLARFTSRTLTSPEAYFNQLEQIRKKGYATDEEEYISGVCAIAAPITGYVNYPAALWVVGFKDSLDRTKMENHSQRVKTAAKKISTNLETPV
ncbi:MAG: IclR family transcriptional regulator [Desulfobacterales bacterium]|nr:IclR family transcriptional regulator [Desulfobacterales bacterium]